MADVEVLETEVVEEDGKTVARIKKHPGKKAKIAIAAGAGALLTLVVGGVIAALTSGGGCSGCCEASVEIDEVEDETDPFDTDDEDDE